MGIKISTVLAVVIVLIIAAFIVFTLKIGFSSYQK